MKLHPFYKHFLVNHEHRFIYCYVPKVACTSLKDWFLRLSNISIEDAVPNLHVHVERKFSLAALRRREAVRLLQSGDYFRFAFVRNPFARIVSGYLNKVVQPEGAGLGAMKAVQKGRAWDLRKRFSYEWRKLRTGSGIKVQQGITFREFLHFVESQSPRRLDPHWRPQSLILGDVSFDYIGLMENLYDDFEQVCRRLGLPGKLPTWNRTRRSGTHRSNQCYADWTTGQLRAMDGYPTFDNFYSPELVKIVHRVYRQDLARFAALSRDDRPAGSIKRLADAA